MIKTSTNANPYSTGELKLDDSHLDLCDSLQQMTEGLSYEVWRDKYRSHKEKTRQESAERVTYAIMGKDESADLTDYYWAIFLGLWMPAGRILAGAGANKRVTLMNCFSGDTEVFTKEYGTIALKELAGRTASVLTKSGWIPSEFKCFGMQKTNTITLKCSRSNRRRKVVRATPNHRWLLKLGGETTDLKVGHLLRSCSAFVEGDREEYRAGLFHGIVFGDGQLHKQTLREVSGGYPLGTFHHVLRACGRVADHYELLDEFCANYKQPPAAKGDRIYYHHGSENFKDFPHGKSADYIQGFIDGWWIADGHYENRGTQRCISSTNYEHLDWLIKNAPLGGYIITGDKIIGKEVTNLGRAKSPCRAVTIMQETHVKGWEVESIEEGHVEPVYCAVVPGEAAFTLSEGLYTGNCYVNQTIDDSMDSILDSLKIAALTMQQGGGIGTDFSTIRPAGAWLTRTGTPASGPGPFMDMWDSMCRTIMSAGARRGAMMGTLSDTHPFLPEFIKAKQTAGRWTMFNISILVSDAFMGAVTEDEDWLLHFPVAPKEDSRKADLEDLDFIDDDGVRQYVYSVWKARELWELITRNTYEYSEPGVIFIDRINELNNLHYCEEIRCTNPCGEQPLPPHGTCNLGAVNLALMVRRPFSESASFNFELLKHIVKMGIRFLDNVIEVTQYPLADQSIEEFSKRRLGLGITGLADALAQMRLRYGSFKAAELTERIMQVIAITAYETSIELAKEKGSFPLFDAEQFLAPNTFAGSCLPSSVQDDIRKHGIRNSHLLTIAPTGTTSVCYWNTSSGVEPVFAHHVNRKVLQPDNSWKTYREWGYGARLYHLIHGKDTELPGYMVTMEELSVDDHIIMQAKAQRWVDASVSKTVNCPEDISYENFVRVYELAYNSGCKGCTTYRPSSIRGSILSSGVESQQIGVASSSPNVSEKALTKRSKALPGITYQIKWPSRSAALYLTINHDDSGLPYEIFVTSKDATNAEWVTALTLMITAIWRRGGDVSFVPGELQQIQSIHDGAFLEGRYFGSLPAYLGYIIEEHMKANLLMVDLDPGSVEAFMAELPSSELSPASKPEAAYTGVICPSCKAPALVKAEGCSRCTNCGYSTC